MKKIFMFAAMTAFIGMYSTTSFAQDEKKEEKTEKKCDKNKKCCKKSKKCCKKKDEKKEG